jgi:hypothetical protein
MGRFSLWPALIAVAGVTTPLVILAFRYRAMRQRVTAHRPITDTERSALGARGRWSIIGFIAFWIISIGLIFTTAAAGASEEIEWAVFAVVILMAFGGVALHLQIRCPVCDYRLGYQRSLGIPKRCERCGAVLG